MRALTVAGLRDVWRYDILPVLAERHYGEGVDLEAWYGLATLRRQTAPADADGAADIVTVRADLRRGRVPRERCPEGRRREDRWAHGAALAEDAGAKAVRNARIRAGRECDLDRG
jgi:hypothetical protein